MLTRIVKIESYAQKDLISAVVEEALATPSLDALLQRSSKPLLIAVKPNWIQQASECDPDRWEPLITNPNLVLAVIDALAKVVPAGSTICICDAPHSYADWSGILSRGYFAEHLELRRSRYSQINLELLDLRRKIWRRKEGVVVERRSNTADPRGYVRLDLGRDSLFFGHRGEGHYYGADYDTREVNEHHRGNVHEYLFAGTPLSCDLFINLPKLKTHQKTGITCCLKNLVGINGDKNWLPHYTEGSPASHGDEFPTLSLKNRIEFCAKRVGRKVALDVPLVGTWVYRKMRSAGKQVLGDSEAVIRNGNWSGNDTCWRMALDLNRGLLYANLDGTWRDRFHPKAYLAVVDGIVGGQGNGPLRPDPVQSNVLVLGSDPAEVDAVVARLMGFDPRRVPIVAHAFDAHCWPITARSMIDEITVFDGRVGRELGLAELGPAVMGGFVPSFGWSNLRDTGAENGLST